MRRLPHYRVCSGYERTKYKRLILPAETRFGGLCVLVTGLLAAATRARIGPLYIGRIVDQLVILLGQR
jgi:hypothetical protein